MELLVKNCEFGLNSEVFKTLLRNKLVDLSEVVGLSDVSESGIASFGNIEVLLLQGKLGESLPVGLDFRSHIERLEDLDSFLKSLILQGSSEFDQGLSQLVRDGVLALIDDDLCLPLGPLDALDVTLHLIHGDLVGLVDGVPDTEVVAVLSDDDIGVGYPAHILAVVEQGLLLLLLDVVEMQLAALVSEEKLGAAWVQLEVVDLAIMRDVGQHRVGPQVLDAEGQGIQEVSDDLCRLPTSELLLGIVKTS
jgi:hypothetical protein